MAVWSWVVSVVVFVGCVDLVEYIVPVVEGVVCEVEGFVDGSDVFW